jgi:cytochrome c-type biogenesis protein CcmE
MLNTTITKIALTIAVAVGGVGFMVYSSIGNAQHYKMVDELMADDLAQWQGKELKVHGWVEAGTIVEKAVTADQAVHRTFILQKGGKKIRVFSVGPKPDTFKDLSEVVATGRLVPAADAKAVADALGVQLDSTQNYVVDATDLMAKCPSKYDGAQVIKQQNKPTFQ